MYKVAAGATVPAYNEAPPYHPADAYPELPIKFEPARANYPYALMRQLFRDLGLDASNFGSKKWSPLGAIVRPGETVIIKPNFVLSRNASGGGLVPVVTHPSIIRAIVDYVFIALRGEGRIIIGDAPQMDCTWSELMAMQRLDTIQELYRTQRGCTVEVVDFRDFEMIDPTQPAYSTNRRSLAGDPAGSTIVNLGRRSEFYGLDTDRFYGADFDRAATIARHQGDRHEYRVSRTVLSADVFISVPKMKVHKKVGVTLNLKGLVGINTDKNCLVHYRLGTPKSGGDQLPDERPGADMAIVRIQRWISDKAMARQDTAGDAVYRAARRVYRSLVVPMKEMSAETTVMDSGNWHGNDSAWRMTRDLLRILHFADAQGAMHDAPQRRMFCVVDGIIGGENNGPLSPDPRPCGCLVMGANPLAVDLATARLMGFDVRTMKQFGLGSNADGCLGPHTVDEVDVVLQGVPMPNGQLFDLRDRCAYFRFKPHPGWAGHIEIDGQHRRIGTRVAPGSSMS